MACYLYESTQSNIMTVCDRCLLHGLHGGCKKQYALCPSISFATNTTIAKSSNQGIKYCFLGCCVCATVHATTSCRYERDRDGVPGMRTLPLPNSNTSQWLCKHCLLQRQTLRNLPEPPNWPTAVVEVLSTRPGECLDACAIWACVREVGWGIADGLSGAEGRARVLSTCLKVPHHSLSMSPCAVSISIYFLHMSPCTFYICLHVHVFSATCIQPR